MSTENKKLIRCPVCKPATASVRFVCSCCWPQLRPVCPCRKYQKLYGAPLVGTRWLLIQLDGEEVANSDGRFSLRFEDAKRLSGRGGCNRYSASCDTEAGGHLRVGPIASTRMTCPEAQRERAFFAMLRSAVRYELDAKMLILSDSIGVRAVFQAAEEDQNTKNQKIN